MIERAKLSQEDLKSLVIYDERTGLFTWRYRKNLPRQEGELAGCYNKGTGYHNIKIHDKVYLAHRLAWLYVFGSWPIGEIDHVNQDKKDNRICNLRDVNRTFNNLNRGAYSNNTSGYRGVFLNKQRGNYIAKVMVDKKPVYLGSFKDPCEASRAVESKLKEMGV